MLFLRPSASRTVQVMSKGNFSKKIIKWYLENHRDLPWRATKDPYCIWISEAILQQTRITQGLPYYERFIRDFPNVTALANAPERKVLRAWQGLGYYNRAQNLLACAKEIVSEHDGTFPKTNDELLKLPGIGSYTAAAIASMAYDQPVAVVDGNVFRVLARLFGIKNDIMSAEAKRIFSQKANELLGKAQPGLFNQAVMEFGALHCTPKSPQCDSCIFFNECVARNNGTQDHLPVNLKKVKVRNRYFTYFILAKGNKLAMKKRGTKDIWNGLYDFHLVESKRNQKAESSINKDSLLKQIHKQGKIRLVKGETKHVLTHQRIHARFVHLILGQDFQRSDLLSESGLKFYSINQIKVLPKPTLITRFLSEMGYSE